MVDLHITSYKFKEIGNDRMALELLAYNIRTFCQVSPLEAVDTPLKNEIAATVHLRFCNITFTQNGYLSCFFPSLPFPSRLGVVIAFSVSRNIIPHCLVLEII